MTAPVTLVGRLGQDPELKFSATGMAVAKLSVVTSRRVKNGDTWEDADTTWWNVTAFRRLAENVAESLRKGQAVIVVGKVKQRSWETPEGEKRSVMEVLADAIGPSLEWDTASVVKAQRGPAPTPGGGRLLEDDPWATGPTHDQPPF